MSFSYFVLYYNDCVITSRTQFISELVLENICQVGQNLPIHWFMVRFVKEYEEIQVIKMVGNN